VEEAVILSAWTIKAGLRWEEGRLVSTSQGVTVRRRLYAGLFPSLHLERELRAHGRFTAALSRRNAQSDRLNAAGPGVLLSQPINLGRSARYGVTLEAAGGLTRSLTCKLSFSRYREDFGSAYDGDSITVTAIVAEPLSETASDALSTAATEIVADYKECCIHEVMIVSKAPLPRESCLEEGSVYCRYEGN